MDYEQKYKHALDLAKQVYDAIISEQQKENISIIFPELAESEDEKIRKIITLCLEECVHSDIIRDYEKEKCLACLEKQGEPKEYTFKSLPRLLDMIEPTSRAKAYCQKLIDTLAKEGYNTDAKIVEEVLKGWNGDDVPLAIMDEQKPTWSKEDEKMLEGIVDIVKDARCKSLLSEIEIFNINTRLIRFKI